MKKVLKGGTVVGGSGSVRADVLIDGEKVAAVGTGEEMERLADEDTQIVDVEGCLLFPGFIDAHTHFDLHVAGTVTADDFATGTRAAVRGGTTTIVDFGTQYEGCLLYTSGSPDKKGLFSGLYCLRYLCKELSGGCRQDRE